MLTSNQPTNQSQAAQINNSDDHEYIALLEEEIQVQKERYESEITDLKRKLQISEAKAHSREITLNSFKSKCNTSIIVGGDEQDIYDGEQKDFVISLIQRECDVTPDFSRANCICKSLLAANKENGTRRRMQAGISTCLKNYKSMTRKVISELKRVGINVVQCGSHYKLYLDGDDRCFCTISATPGDGLCIGRNTISDLNRTLF